MTTSWHSAFRGQLFAGKHPALLLVDPVKAYSEVNSPLYLESAADAIDRMGELTAPEPGPDPCADPYAGRASAGRASATAVSVCCTTDILK